MSEQIDPRGYSPEIVAGLDLLVESSQRTDMQFNIGRIEGQPGRGADIVDPITKERMYCTVNSSEVVEETISRRLGSVLLEKVADFDLDEFGFNAVFNVYYVPPGAKMLIKTFRQTPYHERYMKRLAETAGHFVGSIARLNPSLYGIDPTAISVVPTDDDEAGDVNLIVTPPLSLEKANPVDIERFGEQLVTGQYVDAFLKASSRSRV